MTRKPPLNLEELRHEYSRILKQPGRKLLGPRSLNVLRHMLDDPSLTAVRSISEIAGAYSISTSSITRMAQKLGFDGFPSLQEVFRREVKERSTYYSEQVEGFLRRYGSFSSGSTVGSTGGSPVGQPFQSSVQAEWGNVMASMENFDKEQYARAVNLLVESRSIHILGLRGSYPMAFYFGYYLKMIRDGVVVADNLGNVFAESMVDAGPGDLLFAIGAHPYTKLTVDACRIARQKGLDVVVLTDSLSSPLANEADNILLISAKSDSFFGSITAGTIYVTALLSEMVRRIGSRTVDRLRMNEKVLDELGIETD